VGRPAVILRASCWRIEGGGARGCGGRLVVLFVSLVHGGWAPLWRSSPRPARGARHTAVHAAAASLLDLLLAAAHSARDRYTGACWGATSGRAPHKFPSRGAAIAGDHYGTADARGFNTRFGHHAHTRFLFCPGALRRLIHPKVAAAPIGPLRACASHSLPAGIARTTTITPSTGIPTVWVSTLCVCAVECTRKQG
jgi:hypothetical protein